jgi:hypothetical protein
VMMLVNTSCLNAPCCFIPFQSAVLQHCCDTKKNIMPRFNQLWPSMATHLLYFQLAYNCISSSSDCSCLSQARLRLTRLQTVSQCGSERPVRRSYLTPGSTSAGGRQYRGTRQANS